MSTAPSIAVSLNADGRLEVFFIGFENRIYHNWENPSLVGWNGTNPFQGKAKALTVGQNADSRLEVFYIGIDDNLYHNWQTSTSNAWAGEDLLDDDDQLLVAGHRIFDPGTGIHINDHCFMRGEDGTW